MGTAAHVWSSVLILIFLLRLLQHSAVFSQEEGFQIIFLSRLVLWLFPKWLFTMMRQRTRRVTPWPFLGIGICFSGPSEAPGGAPASFCQPPGDDSSWTWVSLLCPSSNAQALCHHFVFCRVLPPDISPGHVLYPSQPHCSSSAKRACRQESSPKLPACPEYGLSPEHCSWQHILVGLKMKEDIWWLLI